MHISTKDGYATSVFLEDLRDGMYLYIDAWKYIHHLVANVFVFSQGFQALLENRNKKYLQVWFDGFESSF